MNEYILFMHAGAPATSDAGDKWVAYLSKLRAARAFDGGSAIGGGVSMSKSEPVAPITEHITGYIRIQAESLESARELVMGNPVYEAGGTVEIRELPRTD
jgi:hypothetical protein